MKKNNTSYNQILKSTTIFGGSQFVVIVAGIIRAKVVALLLGTTGVGFIGIYQSVIETLRSACSMGLDTAGVKEIAQARQEEDEDTFNKTATRFNKWFKTSAVIGFIICIGLSYPISIWAFDSDEYSFYIAALSVCVFLAILTSGRTTLLQGIRRISEIAKSTIIGSIAGLVMTIPLYYIFGIEGILPSFIGTGLISFICVEYYYRKQNIKRVPLSYKETYQTGLQSLKLGIFIVSATFIGTASMFAVKAFITRTIDIETAGLFQSAWAITNVSLILILRSMGSDFFPRLSAISDDNNKTKQLVNEQTYIVLIISSPVIVGMIAFSGLVISILYSSDFIPANSLLQWQVAGTFLKVLSWPIAFILLAKNKGLLFLLSEVAYYIIYLLSGYILSSDYGLNAWGIAYLVAYAIYLPTVYLGARHVSDFGWSSDIIKMAIINFSLIGCAFGISRFEIEYGIFIEIAIFILSTGYALFKLSKVFRPSDLKNWFKHKDS